MNRRGAVNSYRFLGMYIIIGILMGMITAFQIDTTDASAGYNLDAHSRNLEIANEGENIGDESDELIRASQYAFSANWGDEGKFGRNIAEILMRSVLPYGFIPQGVEAGDFEKGVNNIVIIFRSIIMMFATYELFQIIIKTKTT